MKHTMITYAEAIYTATVNATCNGMYINKAIDLLAAQIVAAKSVYLIGNGGSGAACDHMANDLCLAGIRAQSLTNTNNITCAANDFGFTQVFTKQLEWLVQGDRNLVIAFSCSGKSENILNAVKTARSVMECRIVTFSGFNPDNPLATAGNINFYVPSQSYGVVQLAHEALIHCAIDKIAGLN